MEPADLECLARLAADPRFAARYRIDEPLGRGGMALVARATDLGTGRAVAVKVLAGQWTPEAGERLMREGRSMARVRHPHVLQVFDLGLIQGTPYLVVELAPAGSLREALRETPRFALERVCTVMAPVCGALAALHEHGIVHRDLKPDNILFAEDRQPRVADFGLATLAGGQRLTETGAFVGTVQYAAPEMLSGVEPSPSVDIYAAGVMLFEMLAGQPPFVARTLNALYTLIMVEAPPHLAGLRPDLPPEVIQTVHACLAKRPEDRPQSAAALASQVAGWAHLGPATGAEVTMDLNVKRPRSRPVRRPGASSGTPVPRASPGSMASPATVAHLGARHVALAAGALALAVMGAGFMLRPRPEPSPAGAPGGLASAAPGALAPAERAALVGGLDALSREAHRLFEELSANLQSKASLMMGDDSEPRLEQIGARARALSEKSRVMVNRLQVNRARLAQRDGALLLARARSEAHFAGWCAEVCRRMMADARSPEYASSAHAGDRSQLVLMREFHDSVTDALAGGPAPAEFDGRTLAVLLNDVRAVGRATSMHEWESLARPLARTATASFLRRVSACGPLGDAVARAWTWGERGSGGKANREARVADVAAMRAALAGVARDAGPLQALLGQMTREANGQPEPAPAVR